MEEDKLELQALNQVIENLNKTVECASECDTVTKEEYRIMSNYLEKLENKRIELQISIDGCIIQEV